MNIFKIRTNSNLVNNKDVILYYIVWSIICIILGVLIVYSPYIAISLIGVIGILLFILKEPLKILIFLILISPFAGTVYLKENMFNIPGSKPIIILGVLTGIGSLINLPKASKMPKHASYFAVAIIIIFTISIFRSLSHLNIFNKYLYVENHLTTVGFLLSAYIKEFIFFIPFLVIIKYANNERYLNLIMDIICITMILFSLHLLYIYSQCLKNNMNLNEISGYYSDTYSMHRNHLIMFYICGLPFALRKYFLDKKLINVLFILIILISIGFLFSRTGYVAGILTIPLYLIISKRKKFLPIIIAASIILTGIISTAVIERAKTGLEEKDPDTISAGRINKLWIPLIEENFNITKKFMFEIHAYAHPHNMYLELLLDAGVFSLVIIITFYYVIIRKALIALKNTSDTFLKENLYACIVSIIAFLISGFANLSFFPQNSNIFVWVVLGLTIATYQIIYKSWEIKLS